MPRILRIALVLLAGAAVTAGGCGKKGSVPTGPAKTPKEAIVKFAHALQSGDKAAFLSVVHYPQEAKPAVEAMFDTMSTMMGFMKDLQKEYGEDAVGKMKGKEFPTPEEIESKATIDEERDTATATLPDGNEPMKLVKKDGGWLVDLSEGLPEADQREEMIKTVGLMKKAVEKARANIGKEGYTAEKVMQEFMGEMMKAAMQKSMGG